MADFCQDCAKALFGQDTKDLANLLPPEEYSDDCGALVLCECCGPVIVDINGKRMSKDYDERCNCGGDHGND